MSVYYPLTSFVFSRKHHLAEHLPLLPLLQNPNISHIHWYTGICCEENRYHLTGQVKFKELITTDYGDWFQLQNQLQTFEMAEFLFLPHDQYLKYHTPMTNGGCICCSMHHTQTSYLISSRSKSKK